MKKLFTRTMLLLCALIAGSGSVWADNYEKVTSTAGITDGQYLIVYETNSVAFNGALTKDAAENTVGVSITDSKIESTTTTDAAAVTISVTNGYIRCASNMYIGGKSGSNTLVYSDDVISTTFSIDDSGNFVATSNTSVLRFNKASGQLRFRYYKSTGYSGQQAIQLYKLVSSVKTDPTITFNDGSVRVGKTLDLSTLFSSNSSGAITYSITSGDSYASIDGSNLTGVAVGSVTVQAEQAAAGSYNAGVKTATITVNAALTLSDIAITTAPAKTTYTEGETFDATGMVVTATYSDASTDNVTAACTFSPSTALAISDTEITVSYTENGITKTTTQPITVTEVVDYATLPFSWAGGTSAAFKALTGVSTSSLDDDYAVANAPYYIKFNGTGKYIVIKTDSQIGQLSIGIKKVGGANTSTLIIRESADGENYTDVEKFYTEGATNAELNFSTSAAFKATSRYVQIYFQKGKDSDTGGSNIGVGPISITECLPVTITSAEYATFVSSKALNFSTTGITAYTATDEETKVTLNEVTSGKVPANTPVVLYKAGADGTAINVPVIDEADAISGTNDLRVSTGTDVENMYVLAKNPTIGFYPWTGTNLSAGKIYLQGKASYGARDFIGFGDGETTAINALDPRPSTLDQNTTMYNLAGQKVSNSYKGIVIVNGRKYIRK